MSDYLKYIEYVEEELKEEHYNKIMVANLFVCSMIGLRKISEKLDIKMDEITVKNIVDYVKIVS